MEPAYEHDCDKCVYLGTTGPITKQQKTNATDHYSCSSRWPQGTTLIQRFSSEPSDYASRSIENAQGSKLWETTLQLMHTGGEYDQTDEGAA